MNAPINFQTILGADGKAAFVVLPVREFERLSQGSGKPSKPATVPHGVVSAIVAGATPLAAWREHLRLTQYEVGRKMGISQAAYAQMEAAKRPRNATLTRAAAALGVGFEQLSV